MRVALVIGVSALALFLAWVVGGLFWFVHPRVDHPKHADAVVILGPPYENGRLDVALSLIKQHVADNLVVSVPSKWQRKLVPLCADPHDSFTVICFRPDPSTTSGEAQELRRLAHEHGWTSLAVVTSTYHVSRARMIFGRCFDGRLYMVPARHGISPLDWAYEYAYQTGAYIKAILQSGC